MSKFLTLAQLDEIEKRILHKYSCSTNRVEVALLASALREAWTALSAYDPPMPEPYEKEMGIQYSRRVLGENGEQKPYREHRNRQCSIGYHDECSDPEGIDCKCPCHRFEELRANALPSDLRFEG